MSKTILHCHYKKMKININERNLKKRKNRHVNYLKTINYL